MRILGLACLRLLLMADPAGDGGGGGGAAVAAPAASGADGGGAAAGAGDGADAWASAPLPAALVGEYPDAKTWGDVHSRYKTTAQQAQEYRQQAETERATRERLHEQMADFMLKQGMTGAQNNGGQQAQRDPNCPPGFDSIEQYQQELARDHWGTQKKLSRALIQEDLGGLQNYLQGLQQTQQQITVEKTWNEFSSKYPDFAPGKPYHGAMEQLFRADPDLLAIGQRDPARAFEIARERVMYRVYEQQNKAQAAKANETAAGAATARPGAGNQTGAPANGTWEQKIRARAAEHHRTTGQAVPEAVIRQQIENGSKMGFK